MMNGSPIDAADMKVLRWQLGRAPRGAKAILQKCSYGWPQVILNSPLLPPGTPFPTIYWLTCPLLNKKIAILENQGWIRRFQEQISKDNCFCKAVLAAQINYRETRKIMATDISELPLFARETLDQTGIGGVGDLSKIKCLHAHYAHHLVSGANPIGRRIDELLGKFICEEECEAG